MNNHNQRALLASAYTTTGPLTDRTLDNLIRSWNGRTPFNRAEAARRCRSDGHEWRDTPLTDDTGTVLVCLRCLRYQSTKPDRRQHDDDPPVSR